ncbi:rhomboid family intramembrane serine protease [Pseudomonas lundensis]|uniref:rhomboid family intramembrane serine protease n=1 Tax=Pseudomonas lundensis TaxID=86185 RepID=UPI00089DB7C3|nr:rhomboid family intramembrane serine protease [Pseudomonas lundensis]
MSAVEVLRLPLSVDLSGFVSLLQRMHVPHRVSEEAGEQVVWAPESIAGEVRSLYARFPQGDPEGHVPVVERPPAMARPGWVQQLRDSPATATILLLCVIVAVVTQLGENLSVLSGLTFLDFSIRGQYIQFTPLSDSLAAGQWWRLFSPMLIHFSFLHIAMNGMWYWELGRRVELRQGSINLIGLSLLFSLVSNFAQYLFGGPSLFGGMSGVLYGLLGHVWIYQLMAPNPLYRLPRGVLVMMLVWLAVCMSGLVSLIGFGQIANAAHVGGLLIGCLTGLLGGLWARRKQAK